MDHARPHELDCSSTVVAEALVPAQCPSLVEELTVVHVLPGSLAILDGTREAKSRALPWRAVTKVSPVDADCPRQWPNGFVACG